MQSFLFSLAAAGDDPVSSTWEWPDVPDVRTRETTARVMFGIHTVDKPRNPLPGLSWNQRFLYDPRRGLRRTQPYVITERQARRVRDALDVSALARVWLAHETNLGLLERLPSFEERVVDGLANQMVADAREEFGRTRPIALDRLRISVCYTIRQGYVDGWADVKYDRTNHRVSIGLLDRDDLHGRALIDRADAYWTERLPDLYARAVAQARERVHRRLPELPTAEFPAG